MNSTDLVELLQVLNSHEGELFVLVDVRGISEDAQLHAGARDVGELDGARLLESALGLHVFRFSSFPPCCNQRL